MIQTNTKASLKTNLSKERKNVEAYDNYETNVKKVLETYVEEFNNVSFENEVLKTMILNNFENAIMQVESNLQEIHSLSNALDILESQKSIKPSDIETFNNLESKIEKDMELVQNFLHKTISCFDNVQVKGKKKSITILEECKKGILQDVPITEDDSEEKEKTKALKNTLHEKSIAKSIQKNLDYSSSDLLCFFPKTDSDNLVISTIQDNYKISFNGDIANINIKDDDFNMTLHTSGVQISNSNTNNIIFISHNGSKYAIVTNNQIEIPPFIQVSKIAKDEDFLEVEISTNSLSLHVENNIINFEKASGVNNTNTIIEEVKTTAPVAKHFIIEDETDSIEQPQINTNPAPIEQPKEIITNITPEKPIVTKEQTVATSDNEIKDNDTLIISASNKNVILPYKVTELQEKLKKNKNYKSLQEIIKKEYTIPADTFKTPTKSRFKEAFQLIKKKEHGSFREALELGFELMFQSNLNPAIIRACKDLDELDIYLDCLDDNELDKFSCFKIQYDVPPAK